MWRENLKGCTYTSKSRSRSVTNVFLKISQYSQETLFNKVADLQACNFIRMRLYAIYSTFTAYVMCCKYFDECLFRDKNLLHISLTKFNILI